MRIMVATDAWHPQINGVVRSLTTVAREAAALGAEIRFLTPQQFVTLPLPTYAEIEIAMCTEAQVARAIADEAPDFVHVATEGPVGWMTRRAMRARGRRFTTSYHTRFPEYVAARLPVPPDLTYAMLRRFHNAGAGTMVATRSIRDELTRRGFARLMHWTRGVDLDRFFPCTPPDAFAGLPRPIFLYVGRVAVEKNIEAFLGLDLPGTRVVVGGGPSLDALKAQHPDVLFTGPLTGEALTRHYAGADVFVFPSLTDTFGNVMLEALACGTPVAAFPVPGPVDVIGESGAGVLGRDLRAAALAALDVPRDRARAHAATFSWRESARQFLDNILEANRLAVAA